MKLVNTHIRYLIILAVLLNGQFLKAQTWTKQQCIDTAMVQNKKLKMERNSISIGEEKVKEAKANLIPKVTANADYKYFTNLPYQLMPLSTFNPSAPEGQFKEAQFGVPHNINANLQVALPIYNPMVYGAIKATTIADELNSLNYQKTEEQIYFEVSNLYYNAQIIHHQLAFLDSNLINAEKLLKNISLLHKQLLVKGTDVSKIKLQVSQLKTQKENVRSKYEQVLNALKFTMGKSIEEKIEIDATIEHGKTSDYTVKLTLDKQFVALKNQMLTNELNILNKSRYLPSLNLIGSLGTTGFGYDRKPNDFLKFFPIGFAGVQFSYSLFNGSVTYRKVLQKKMELENNKLQSDLINDQNNMQVVNASLQKTTALQSITTSQEQIDQAKNIYNQTLLEQKQGLASITDVLLADNTLREAQQVYLSSIIEYLKADLELKKATGNISNTKI